MSTNVRLATIQDAESLSSLNQEFNGGDKRSVSEIMKSLNSNNELVAVATIMDEVVGFACAQSMKSFCYNEAHGEITEMYVQESARRNGVATSLISFLEKQLLTRGVKTVKILTGRDNNPAIQTYELSGYIKDDEVMLKKKL
ncbi:GNAT family N-acetyltransferase [Paenibacillus agri]|uniref:GNAT family N-acetyltransferase n=1 Tax=Paenibacillus agri TaxID=2744309 RepID=A0A850ELV3_9BACL|nr:GNAT family N-acetyltransferase [Paenibacillus agri]NUU60709.1 GNAT family N-acetyltransferase [Paenibacillus agri]